MMPKFAANLSMMFKERPFLERFSAAADCGFKAVEFLWPYDYSIEDLKDALGGRLELALFNTRPGDVAKGEWGIAALPGREREFQDGFEESLEYATRLQSRPRHGRRRARAGGARALRADLHRKC